MASVREDYYQLLDAEPTASKQELRDAYRRVAKRYHPDHNADDPAAEERFKLIGEAWRTLGDEEKRAEYDDWLERHRRYAAMPELDTLPRRRVRVSARRVQERNRERRRASDERRSYRARPFLLRPKGSKVSGLSYVMISLCFVISMVPYLRHHLAEDTPPQPVKNPALGYGESPLPPEEQRRNMENYVHRLVERAERGDAVAQYRYGFILYMGIGGQEQDKEAARRWWERSAVNGNRLAKEMLHNLDARDQQAPAGLPEPLPGDALPTPPQAP